MLCILHEEPHTFSATSLSDRMFVAYFMKLCSGAIIPYEYVHLVQLMANNEAKHLVLRYAGKILTRVVVNK